MAKVASGWKRTGRVGRRLALLPAVVALALAGTVVTASPAGALSCYAGTVCVYRYNESGSTTLIAATEGSITSWIGVSYWGGYVWNNGVHWPGADHIRLDVTLSDGAHRWTCLHYGARTYTGDPTAIYLPPFTTVESATWRGECAAWEEGWNT